MHHTWGGSGEYLTTNSLNEVKLRFPEDAAYGDIYMQNYVIKDTVHLIVLD